MLHSEHSSPSPPVQPERGFNRALRDDVQVNPSTGPFQTVHRSSWKDHYDDDHVYWKGWAAGRVTHPTSV